MMRHKVRPGAPACTKARSMRPSLLKSSAATATVGDGIAGGVVVLDVVALDVVAITQGCTGFHAPSRGLIRIWVAAPATTRYTARSSFTSLPSAAAALGTPRPASAVASVNVPLP